MTALQPSKRPLHSLHAASTTSPTVLMPRSAHKRRLSLRCVALTSLLAAVWGSSFLLYLFDLSMTPSRWLEAPSTPSAPAWMTEYVAWHRETRAQLTFDNWSHHRYLVVRCLSSDHKCGGASDRLQGVPFFLLLAAQTSRVLLIEWQRPYPLEEFLQPPASGIDWRRPDWLPLQMGPPDITSVAAAKRALTSNATVLSMRLQSTHHGADYYNELANGFGQADFDTVYRTAWNWVFEPSPNVLAVLQAKRAQLPSHYQALHIRSIYTSDRSSDARLIANAVDCLANHSSLPVFVATDHVATTTATLEYAQQRRGLQVHTHRHEPVHLDRGHDFLALNASSLSIPPPSAYYGVFVDLYLLSDAACIAVGVGGFGRWAHKLSASKCAMNHARQQCRRLASNRL